MDTSKLLQIFGFVEPKINTVSEKGNVGEYLISPLKEGIGTTVGNSFRRTLLTSMPGAAITEIKVSGIFHEFTTVSGVSEDVLEITLNFKAVRLQMFEEDSAILTLDVKGEKIVKAGDLKCPSNVKVVNPDAVTKRYYNLILSGTGTKNQVEIPVCTSIWINNCLAGSVIIYCCGAFGYQAPDPVI